MKKNSAKLSVGFLFDDTLDSNDGVSQYVKAVGAWLSAQGHHVCYLVGQTKLEEWAGGKVYSLARNQKVTFNGNKLSMPLPASRQRIKEVLSMEDLDVIHVQVPYSPFMAQMVIKAADPKTAVVGTFHILPASKLVTLGSRGLRLLYGRSLGRFNAIVSTSQPTTEFAKSAFGINSSVLPNVVDLARFAPKRPVKRSGPPRVVFLGRLVERKGAMQLLKAFTLLHRRLPEVKLVIAGGGPLKSQLESYVAKHELQDHVTFPGFIEEADKPALLSGADIACFPSLYGESFGIVLIEAMAAGAGVVIGGNNPGYSSVLGERPELLFDPLDTKVFSKRLEELLQDKHSVSSLHAWQQTEVQQYDVAVVGERLVAIYEQAIAKQRLKRHN